MAWNGTNNHDLDLEFTHGDGSTPETDRSFHVVATDFKKASPYHSAILLSSINDSELLHELWLSTDYVAASTSVT